MSRSYKLLIATIILSLLNPVWMINSGEEVGYWFQNHSPIDIQGDMELSTFAVTEGWTGDGSSNDPYVIENYSINSTSPPGAIRISNTSSHILIKNCYLWVLSGTGINASDADNITAQGLSVLSDGSSSVYGIRASGANSLRIEDCSLEETNLSLVGCSEVDIDNLTVSRAGIALDISGSSGISISNSTFEDQGKTSVSIRNSRYFLFRDNLIADSSESGILMDNISHSEIASNRITRSLVHGLISEGNSDDNDFHSNLFSNSGDCGMTLRLNSDQNDIRNNSFIYNNGTGETHNTGIYQAEDSSSGNSWDGNHWADWTLPDTDHDGIVDLPYRIGGATGSKDNRPLVDDPWDYDPAPSLFEGSVDPVEGNTSTVFDFSVGYRDRGGKAPDVRIRIDGSSYIMGYQGGNVTEGVNLSFETTLSAGEHLFHFVALYGEEQDIRYPKNGDLMVKVSDIPGPTLTNGSVKKMSGNRLSFHVDYHHPGGILPDYIRLETDRGTYDMSHGSKLDSAHMLQANLTLEMSTRGYLGYLFSCMDQNGNEDFLTDSGSYFHIFAGNPPKLYNGSVNPPYGSEDDDYTFSVLYGDPQNITPDEVRLILEQDMPGGGTKVAYPEMELVSGTNAVDGLKYNCTIGSDEMIPGYHHYSFHAEIDEMEVEGKGGHLYVTGVAPLMLGKAEMIDDMGPVYRFQVVFDLETEKSPDFVKVHIDGAPFFMEEYTAPEMTRKIFTFDRETEPGEHTFYFTALQDGSSYREPSTPLFNYTLTVPVPVNRAPSLFSGVVNPASGDESTMFVFSVIYSDPERDPAVITLHLDDILMNTNCTEVDYNVGVICSFSTRLSAGIHGFFFTCVDSGGLTARFPESGHLNLSVDEGWNQTGIAPKARAEATVRGMSVILNGSGSSDMDGRIISYLWEFGGESYSGAVREITVEEMGIHKALLMVTDDDSLTDIAEVYFFVSGSENVQGPLGLHYCRVNADGEIESTLVGDPQELTFRLIEGGDLSITLNLSGEEKLFLLDIPISLFPDEHVIFVDGVKIRPVDEEYITDTGGGSAYSIIEGDDEIQLILRIDGVGTREVIIGNEEGGQDSPLYLLIPIISLLIIVAVAAFILMRIGKGNGSDPFKDFVISSGRIDTVRKRKGQGVWEEFLED